VVVQCLVTCGECFYCRCGLNEMCTRRSTIGLHRDGAFAPLVAVPAAQCITLPNAVSLRAAAMTEPIAVGARAVAMSGIEPGDTVALLGPGMIGIGLVLMAKAAGAARIIVAGTSRDAARLAVCRNLGADCVVDVEAEALVPRLKSENDGEGVDIVFEATGRAASVADGLASVRQGGGVVAAGIHDKPLALDLLALVRGRRRVIGSHASRRKDWDRAISMMAERGPNLESALISHALPFSRGDEGFRLSREAGVVKVMMVP
jgi:threonine dehydrogenase-like Zn-dependent dehydrogenase